MPDVNDMALLREYAARNSELAFETLARRHVSLVYSVALRQVGNPAQAEEITQAVFLILARKAAWLRPDTVLAGWLHETARFASGSFLRGERRRRRREQEAYMQSKLQESSDPAWEQLAPLLDEAIGQLGKTDRNAVVLRFFQGKSAREIAAALNVHESAAQKRLNRAVEKLRAYFLKHGVAVSSGALTGAISLNSIQGAPIHLTASVMAVSSKGTVVSSSTLTLIKGALKLMAWTKAQTAAVATAVVILAVGTTTVAVKTIHAARVAAYPDIQGAWEGVALLDDAGVAAGEAARTHVVLKLIKSNGVYSATTGWIEKGRRDVPMGKVVYDYPSLRLEWNTRDTWNLKVNTDATQMIWDHAIHFIQPDPVLLTRTTSPDPVPERLVESDFAPLAGSDLQGYWTGAIGNGPDALPVDLKIAQQADGTFRAEADNPMQGANGRPMSVIYNRPTVKLALASGAGMFQGRINNANTEITGSWIQGGQSTATTVKRADYQAEHAQDADKDYSFTSGNDLQGCWKGSWVVTLGKVKATIRLVLNIAKLPDGTYSAVLANIDQFGNDDPIPTSDFQYSPPDVHMEWKWAGGAFEGNLKNGKLTGTWLQGGGGFPLVFERSELK